jgi:endonuclease/exonuclease/phosphatase family metal-dependent hydrolase
VLLGGGLRDAAAIIDAPWQPSCGHWADDPFGPRRVDGIRVTAQVAPAVTGVETIRSDLAPRASDHLPVVVTVDTDRIA